MLSATVGTGALLEAPLDHELMPTVGDVATLRQSVLGLSEAKSFSALPRRNSEPKNAVDDDSAIIVAAAVNGERLAVERVLRWIRPLVVRYCRARVGGQEKTFASADDVAQEVCLAVLTALPSYRDQGRPFLSFVYGIASHKVADAHRSSARNRSEPVPEVPEVVDHTEGPEAQVVQAEFTGRMARLLETLPERQREVLMLRVVVGLSAEETAEVVGSTPGAVRVAQHRALNRLHKVLTSRARSGHGGNAGESSP